MFEEALRALRDDKALQSIVDAALSQCSESEQELVLNVVSWVVDELDGYGRASSRTKARAAASIAIEPLDMKKILEADRESLPSEVQELFDSFSKREWEDILITGWRARLDLRKLLAQPQWAHLAV